MSSFELAIRAQIPLIGVSTNDLVNVKEVIQHFCEGAVLEYGLGEKRKSADDQVFFYAGEKGLPNLEDVYKEFSKKSCTLVIVNHKDNISVYNAGVLPTPRELIQKFLVPEYMDNETAGEILPSLSGLTIKEVTEVLMLTQAREGGVDAPGIIKTRQEYGGTAQGLEIVSTFATGYVPDPQMQLVAKFEKEFFLGDGDIRFRPRGILATGIAGCGKTAAAKFLARKWGVPLFRLDATVQSKWVGETELQLKTALAKVEELGGVFLIDEVEKMFNDSSDSGVTSKMLGSLLWWLQEHKAKVFTFMTCNDITKIPKELYRPGRIDQVIEFQGLQRSEAVHFCAVVLKSFDVAVPDGIASTIVKENYSGKNSDARVPHAKIHAGIIRYLKEHHEPFFGKRVDSKKNKKVR